VPPPAWLWSGPGGEFPQFPRPRPDEAARLPVGPWVAILEAMIWETLGWMLDHPIWSALVVAIVAETILRAGLMVRAGRVGHLPLGSTLC
jgi:hypothetical protein